MRLIIFNCLLLMMLSCKDQHIEKSTESVYIEIYNNDSIMWPLKERVINNYDTNAYNELRLVYMLSGNREELLYYSLYIIGKIEYATAYFDSHVSYPTGREPYQHVLRNYYLLKAYELGNYESKEMVSRIFNDSMHVPSANDYLKNFFCNAIKD